MRSKESAVSVYDLDACIREEAETHQASDPIRLTNLSKSAAPNHAINAHTTTTTVLNAFFSHLTFRLRLPLFCAAKIPFSMIRTAGNSWSGVERRIAMLYRNWDALTNLSSCGRLTKTTVCACGFRTKQSDRSQLSTDRHHRRTLIREQAHLDLAPVRQVPERASSGKEEHRADHDACQDARELLRLAHRFRYGQDQPDSLKRKDGRPARTGSPEVSISRDRILERVAM
jgi:hypothetical protein